jgi:uncharacterized protein (TIGR00251 family)
VRIRAPALEDRANEALIEFIAQRLGIARREVALASGAKSRQKKIAIAVPCDPLQLLSD